VVMMEGEEFRRSDPRWPAKNCVVESQQGASRGYKAKHGDDRRNGKCAKNLHGRGADPFSSQSATADLG
jgi:hypothetical protein